MNTLKYLLFVASITTLVSTGSSSTLDTPGIESRALVLSRQRRDIFVNTRNLINDLVANLQQSAATAADSLANFTSQMLVDAQHFQDKLAEDISNLTAQVQGAVDQAVGKVEQVSEAVFQCVENERGAAEELFNATVNKVTDCAAERIQEFSGQLNTLAELNSNASRIADEALQAARACGDSGNYFAVGGCLFRVLVETQMNAVGIAAHLGVVTTQLGIGLASLPSTLQVCASTRIAEAALQLVNILLDIQRCAAGAFINAV